MKARSKYPLLKFVGILLSLFAFVLCACKPSIPMGILSESALENILYDYTLAESMAETMPCPEGVDRESLRYQYIQKVFEKHNIDEAEFDSTMVWYSSDGTRLQAIFQRLNERFDAEAKTYGVDLSETELYARYSAMDGDTANVWNGSSVLFLSNNKPDNVKVITIPVDSTFLPGDTYKLSFNSHYLFADGKRSANVLFSVYYADSSVVSNTMAIGGNYRSELNVSPSARQDSILAERIVITLYHQPLRENEQPQIFYITTPSVLRMHKILKTSEAVDELQDVLSGDSLKADTLHSIQPDTAVHRLSPLEERDQRVERHDIEIVKERIVKQPAANQRRRTVSRRGTARTN